MLFYKIIVEIIVLNATAIFTFIEAFLSSMF